MMPEIYYAHTSEFEDKTTWQPLEDHLRQVAATAEAFADAFGAGEWGRLAGLLHDAGKASRAFQHRLEGASVKVDHSTFGARLAEQQVGQLGKLLAYVIAGHHGGLPDGGEQESQLHYRLKHQKIPLDIELLTEVQSQKKLGLPFKLVAGRDGAPGFCLSFFTRMVYSCLVDADFLDTEKFCDPARAESRGDLKKINVFSGLKGIFDAYMAEKIRTAVPSPVNDIRQAVLAECRHKALVDTGIFSLTVPTGGGKTLSSLAFAIDHAVKHGMNRIIYAIPFTSIIEQNAKVFQQALGNECVLEHHCNYKEQDAPEYVEYLRKRGLACENWDMPVVVTTNVQFFESLFSNKPSRCRKLHNIVRSVIILDEAQAIPTGFIEPCLAALRELVDHYGCSVVLCTATQPAFDDTSNLRIPFSSMTEIISNPQTLFDDLSRTEVELIGKISDAELVARLQTEPQVLCILPTKNHARKIYFLLQDDGTTFHLSTNMYPQHRRRVLDEVKTQLKLNKPCRLISTSLVEAGVDLDFPVVYRAMSGLDSIAQAAGRCNREGKMREKGKVYVFQVEKLPSMPWLARTMSRAAETLRSLPDCEPLGLTAMRRYFELLYDIEELDTKQIFKRLNILTPDLVFHFREIAEDFKLIGDETIGIIIPAGENVEKLINELRYSEYPRNPFRRLQQYSVAVRHRDFGTLQVAGALEMVQETFPVLRNLGAYRRDVGLCVEQSTTWDCSELIC